MTQAGFDGDLDSRVLSLSALPPLAAGDDTRTRMACACVS